MKVAVISSHTTSLFWFRMDMMRSFIQRGHNVIAIGSESEGVWRDRFDCEQIEYFQITVSRNGINPILDIRTYLDLKKLLKQECPDKIFVYQAKSIAYSCIAAHKNKISDIYPMVAGLGSIFRGEGTKNRIIKAIMMFLYKRAFHYSRGIFFQNNDDLNEMLDNHLLEKRKAVIINGSGVNLNEFRLTPLPENPAFLYIGRLIRDKGVYEYLEACKLIKSRFSFVRCLLIGPFDTNPSSLRSDELQPYIENGIIEYFGEQKDVRPYIAQCSTYVLPSYHEGTPKSVLESMAMGRAIITSDAPGCRETTINGVNGYLVEVKNIGEIVKKMIYLIEHPEINKAMGLASHKIAVEKYEVNKVNQSIIDVMGL